MGVPPTEILLQMPRSRPAWWSLPARAAHQQVLSLDVQPERRLVVPVIGVAVGLERGRALRRKRRYQLAERAEAALVPGPDVGHAVVVGVVDTGLEVEREVAAEQALDVARIAPRTPRGQRAAGRRARV